MSLVTLGRTDLGILPLNNHYPHSRNIEQEIHKRTSCFSYARNQKVTQNGT